MQSLNYYSLKEVSENRLFSLAKGSRKIKGFPAAVPLSQ